MPAGVKVLGWVATVVAIGLLVVMVAVTLPHLGELAGGPVFDARPLGYDFATAQEIVTRLGATGAAYYENVQHRVDFAFPIALALALIFWLIVAARNWQGHGLPLSSPALGAILTLAIAAGAANLGENAAVSAMLAVGASELTRSMVDTTRLFTLATTFFTALSVMALIVLALGPIVLAAFIGRKR